MVKLLMLVLATTLPVAGGISIGGGNDKPIGKSSYIHVGPSLSNPSKSDFNYRPSDLSKEPIQDESFTCPMYGPFKVGDPDFDATFTYKVNITSQDIIERIRIFNSEGRGVYASTKASKFYQSRAKQEVTFTIPISDYLTRSGMTLKFEIVSRMDRSILKAYSASLYPLTESSLSYLDLKNNIYESKPLGFYGDGKTMKEVKEIIDFTKMGDFLDIDYYYRLNIKDIPIKYDSKFALAYDSINLRFEDHDNLFPYCKHDNRSNITLPLVTDSNNSDITLKYKDTFFVDKRTLQTANTAYPGFTSTSDFYLPVNGKKAFNQKILYIEFVNYGQSKINATFPIRYVADRSLTGLCGDGGYYVEGGVR